MRMEYREEEGIQGRTTNIHGFIKAISKPSTVLDKSTTVLES